MRKPTREDLHAYAAGALDPGRAADVEQELSSAPELLAEIARIRAALAAGTARDWPLPPPGIASGRSPLRAEAAPVPTMGPRDRRLRIRLPGAASDAWILVLFRAGGEWRVASPTGPGDAVTAGELSLGDGAPVVELVLAADTERVAIALIPPGVPVDWDAPEARRWDAVKRGIDSGEIPSFALESSR